MYKLLLVICLPLTSIVNGQNNPEIECKTTVELDVVIDTLYPKPVLRDTTKETKSSAKVDKAGTCNPCYVLRPLNSNYRVVSYVAAAEDNDNNINEAMVSGNSINYTRAGMVIRETKKGEDIWFTCIRAFHTNGQTYILRPLSIRLK